MASALLGTIALLHVDRLLRRLGVSYERWVDDFIIAAATESVFLAVRQAVSEQLGLDGQGLNPAKDWYDEPAGPTASFGDPDLLDSDVDDMPELSAQALEEALSERDPKRCRFILGGLRSRGDGSAVPTVATSDLAWVLVPRYAADYLVACRSDLTDDHLEVMTARCAASPCETTAAGVAHGARVLSCRRVPGDLGSTLHEAADRISTGPYRGAVPSLYHAGSVSQEKPRVRCERSIETAGAVSDLLSARALVAGLRYDTRSRVVDDGLRALAACRPDLAPTVAWVGA